MLLQFSYFRRDSENISISGAKHLSLVVQATQETVGEPNYECVTNDRKSRTHFQKEKENKFEFSIFHIFYFPHKSHIFA